MALTSQQREAAWKYWSDHRSADPNVAPAKFTKDQLRAALDAATTWIESNQASYVSSLAGTAFAGAGSTADEKLRLFLAALAYKFDIGI
jgi:hypothetical protein